MAQHTPGLLDQLASRCPAVLEINGLYEQRLGGEVDKKPETPGSRNRNIQDMSKYSLSGGSDIWAMHSLGVPGHVG